MIHAVGFEAATHAFGLNEQGRQILEYMPGTLWHDSPTHSHTELRRVGSIIHALHRASASFQEPIGAEWNTRYQLDNQEIVCHNDLAPWNLVCGFDRWVFIDWDAAAPATRLWDLAWSSICFPPFEPRCDLKASAVAMHSLLSGYGLDTDNYGELIRLMVVRSRAEYGLIVDGAVKGQQPWVKLHSEGHHRYWGSVADYIDQNASALEAELVSLNDVRPKS